jgi:hypothetical protein
MTMNFTWGSLRSGINSNRVSHKYNSESQCLRHLARFDCGTMNDVTLLQFIIITTLYFKGILYSSE